MTTITAPTALSFTRIRCAWVVASRNAFEAITRSLWGSTHVFILRWHAHIWLSTERFFEWEDMMDMDVQTIQLCSPPYHHLGFNSQPCTFWPLASSVHKTGSSGYVDGYSLRIGRWKGPSFFRMDGWEQVRVWATTKAMSLDRTEFAWIACSTSSRMAIWLCDPCLLLFPRNFQWTTSFQRVPSFMME